MPNGAQRKIVILRAAGRLFHRYGPNKTTVADIAREARIGIGTVYLEFSSKGAILEALSRDRHERVLAEERRALEGSGPVLARLRAALDARFEAFVGSTAAGRHGPDLFHCGCTPIELAHARFREAETLLFADFLAWAANEGALRFEGTPASAARALLRAYAAFAPPLVFRNDPETLREELGAHHALVLRGLQPDG